MHGTLMSLISTGFCVHFLFQMFLCDRMRRFTPHQIILITASVSLESFWLRLLSFQLLLQTVKDERQNSVLKPIKLNWGFNNYHFIKLNK